MFAVVAQIKASKVCAQLLVNTEVMRFYHDVLKRTWAKQKMLFCSDCMYCLLLRL